MEMRMFMEEVLGTKNWETVAHGARLGRLEYEDWKIMEGVLVDWNKLHARWWTRFWGTKKDEKAIDGGHVGGLKYEDWKIMEECLGDWNSQINDLWRASRRTKIPDIFSMWSFSKSSENSFMALCMDLSPSSNFPVISQMRLLLRPRSGWLKTASINLMCAWRATTSHISRSAPGEDKIFRSTSTCAPLGFCGREEICNVTCWAVPGLLEIWTRVREKKTGTFHAFLGASKIPKQFVHVCAWGPAPPSWGYQK